MNPKSVNDLDPKLREAYERVMGSNFTPKSVQNTSPQPAAQPQASQQSVAPNPTDPQSNTPLMQTTQVFTQNPVSAQPPPQQQTEPIKQEVPSPSADPTSIFTQSPSSTPALQKKKLNMLPILFAVGAIVFFGAYIVIWAKVFGLF